MQVQMKTRTNNPFYGMRNNLNLFQNASSLKITEQLLDECWKEVLDGNTLPNVEKAEMFFSLVFSIGDITARTHNIFKHMGVLRVDNGGAALRENFRIVMLWLKKKHSAQYIKFMNAHLFNEYTTFDNLLAVRVQTQKKTNKISGTIDMLGDVDDMKMTAEYIANIIKGKNPFDKFLVAKYLTRPRLSKRKGHKAMLPTTKLLMKKKTDFLCMVSDLCDFPYQKRGSYVHFTGYYEWRKQYMGEMESVLFSSKAISEFDKPSFIKWLDTLPSTARLRVRNRLLNKTTLKDKWGEMGKWFLEWENFKTTKQSEQRVIEEKVRQGDTSEETLQQLKEVKKEAKVTTGAISFESFFGEMITGTVDELKIQPFLDKIKLDYNTLVFADNSGSMRSTVSPKYKFSAFDFASFIVTVALLKNPSDVGRSLFGLFSNSTRLFRHIDAVRRPVNQLLNGQTQNVKLPLVDPQMTFMQNLNNLRAMMNANMTYNGTYINTIPQNLHTWANGDSAKIELLREFPVWTIITDGNFNSLSSPESSMNDFMYKCETYFGFKPFVVAIDVGGTGSANAEKFSGIENFMFVPPNPAQVEQFLTNFRDMDVMDVYTPLQGIHRSNRYELVRRSVL